MMSAIPIRTNTVTRMAAAVGAGVALQATGQEGTVSKRPNIILCMADDMGWGDTGYNGHPHIQTPNLDRMAAEGLRFDRWYAAAPVCSPTRGSCITGRHPYRYGIYFANVGHVRKEEITLAEALRPLGYTTGHFGKWHIGTLTRTIRDGRRGGREGQDEHYSPPWHNGFDECFSTEVAVPTWNPMKDQRRSSRYWTGPDEWATDNMDGDDSRVIMDRAVPFIRKAAEAEQPFLAVIWFHTPHSPVIAGPEYRAMYSKHSEDHQHYYGCITAMDEQVGRLRNELRELGIDQNTMLWFMSDNGPAGEGGGCAQNPGKRQRGSPGPYRGRKGSLYEGGVRVPGLLVWPETLKTPSTTSVPCSGSDYFPTVLDALGYRIPEQAIRPYDGVSLLPLMEGKMNSRPRPIGFQSREQQAFTDNRFKLYTPDKGKTFELYDLQKDAEETTDISAHRPDVVAEMTDELNRWLKSVAASDRGDDYRQELPEQPLQKKGSK